MSDLKTSNFIRIPKYFSRLSFVQRRRIISTEQAANCFEPPSWFGHEVTEDMRFSYGTLARGDGMEIVRQILNSMYFCTFQNTENY